MSRRGRAGSLRLWDKGFAVILISAGSAKPAMRSARRFVTNMAARIDAKQRADKPEQASHLGRTGRALRLTVRSSLLVLDGAARPLLGGRRHSGWIYPSTSGFFTKTLLAIALGRLSGVFVRHSLVPDDETWQIPGQPPCRPACREFRFWVLIAVCCFDVLFSARRYDRHVVPGLDFAVGLLRAASCVAQRAVIPDPDRPRQRARQP